MIIIRALTSDDKEAFIKLAFEAGIGMTGMPKNYKALIQRLLISEESFKKKVSEPGNEHYLFVLEDLETGQIGGMCGIKAKTGYEHPLYFYRLDNEEEFITVTNSFHKIPILRLVSYNKASSEIGSLYLDPHYRKGGWGRLLSLSRFLFIASHQNRFDPMIFAEIRGEIDENNKSLFWEGIGRHFFPIEYETLMHFVDDEATDVFSILPNHPIYLSLLPKEIQEAIGKVHPLTRPALNMLIQEGFQLTEEIDIFDGGPKIEAETKEIRTVKESLLDKIVGISEQTIHSPLYILSNNKINFRSCFGNLIIANDEQGIIINREIANALELSIGDYIRYIAPLIPQQGFLNDQ